MNPKRAIAIACLLVGLVVSRAATTPEANATGQPLRGSSFYEVELNKQRDFGEQFKSGATNTPLLILVWFMNDHYAQSCVVTRDGMAALSDYGEGGFGSGRGSSQLDPNQQRLLSETIEALPVPPATPPRPRWLLVSGIRSNEWFTGIYDRADVPVAVEKLFEIAHGRLEWIVADTGSSTNIVGRFADTWVTSLQAADNAPLAVSSSAVASGRNSNSIQLWDTKSWREITVPAVEEFTTWPWSAAVLSSDGAAVAIGAQGARLVDLNMGKTRWDSKLQGDDRLIKKLAFVQSDKLLAVAFLNSVELWDSMTGHKLEMLATNEPAIDLMAASRDGKFLAVVSGKKKIQVWDLANRKIIHETMDEPYYVYAIEFSPDSKYLAVSGAPYYGSFMLWDLKTGDKTRIPARGLQNYEQIRSLAWSPDGKMVTAAQAQEVMLYDAQTWKPLTRWTGVGGDGAVAFAGNEWLLARLKDGSLRALKISSINRLIKP